MDVRLEAYTPSLATDVSTVLARAFVTNPLHVAAFGPSQLERNAAFFLTALRAMPGPKWVASSDSGMLGFIHWTDSSHCRLSGLGKIRMTPVIVRRTGLSSAVKVVQWSSLWSRRDPRAPHVHLGPIGVLPEAQGRRIGHRLMELYCQEVDGTGEAGYLETDRPENVEFYRRFGFETSGEAVVLGVRNYFMWRGARSEASV
jgi:GNAT superfamily N-acetyltransferase